MRTITKTVITIVLFIVCLFLFGVINTNRHNEGFQTAGPIGNAVLLGMIIGIFAIWKYKPSKEESKDDKHKLDKN